MKTACIFGTRPEAIKMAPVVRALEKKEGIDNRVIVTAQHRQMLDGVLDLFGIRPDHDLDIMRAGQTLTQITCRALEGLQTVLAEERPDVVLVHGDTTTTFCASLAAFYEGIDVAHVEAGLRTHNPRSPFPEEINRRLTGVMTTCHYAPTETARQNLLRENVPASRIRVTGNTVIDALLAVSAQAIDVRTIPGLAGLDPDRRLLLLTSHRRENLGDKMRQVFRAVADLAAAHAPDLQVVFPMHLNPKVRAVANEMLGGRPNVFLIEPQDYLPFVSLMRSAHLILSDSGGIQEEAPALGVPVIVLRDTTERPEAIEAGTVILGGTTYQSVYNRTEVVLSDDSIHARMSRAENPYGDGHAAERIADHLHEESQKD